MHHNISSPSKSLRCAGVLALLLSLFTAEVLLTGVTPAGAQANVTIAPTRVVFEERDRSEELILFNRGGEPVTYRIGLVGMHMDEDGSMTQVQEPVGGQLFAHDLLRYAPRQIRLEPGQSQRVRVMVRKPADLPEGEYRSHLLFQAVPDAPEDTDEGDVDEGQLALRLNIISGLSIPTIVRHGDLSVDLSIQDMELLEAEEDDEQDRLRFRLQRDGDRSTYGRMKIEFIADSSDENPRPEPVQIGRRGGTAMYTPNESRTMTIGLNPPPDIQLQQGRIVVTYREDEDSNAEPLATGELHLE